MANTKNKYGRQIFLSREEIQYLRDLVYNDIISSNDNKREAEESLEFYEGVDAKIWQVEIDELDKRIKMAGKLVGDPEGRRDGKLWYYVSASEADNV